MALVKVEVILTHSIFMSKLRLCCNLKSGLDKLGTKLRQCVTLVIHHAGSDYLAKNMKYVSGQTFLSYGVINLNIFFLCNTFWRKGWKSRQIVTLYFSSLVQIISLGEKIPWQNLAHQMVSQNLLSIVDQQSHQSKHQSLASIPCVRGALLKRPVTKQAGC